MTNIILSGCSGKMGASIIGCAAARTDCKISAGVDIAAPVNADFEYAKSFSEITAQADVIIDFSNPVVLDDMLSFAIQNKLPCVICTTGYNEEQKAKIFEAAKSIPVFYSGNMSLGINLIIELAKKAAAVFVALQRVIAEHHIARNAVFVGDHHPLHRTGVAEELHAHAVFIF